VKPRRQQRATSTDGRHPWLPLVERRGGVALESPAAVASEALRRASFVAALVYDEGLLPAAAKLTPAQAAGHLLLEEVESGAAPLPGVVEKAASLAAELGEAERDVYLLKEGRVGGPKGVRGSREVRGEHWAALLDSVAAGTVEWEEDPDFGYLLAVGGVAGIEARDRDVLVPRFLYRKADRAYEHAALVAEVKRRRQELLAELPDLDPAIAAAIRGRDDAG
jgi:phosphoenolpyruvate carboxykinase (ATP)